MKILITKREEKGLKELKKINKKPLFGNNRSFSNKATSRKFKLNKQKLTISGKHYYLPVKLIKTVKYRTLLFLQQKNGA